MKISIITAVYNNESTIKKTIESVINQTYTDIEYIVIDGKSTDNTLNLVKNYSENISRIISENDEGMYYALNKGIKLASGEIIGFLHADDFYSNNLIIEKIANEFKKSKSDSLYGDLQYVRKADTNKIIRNWKSGEFIFENLKKGWMPPHPTFFVKKEIYKKLGVFDTSYKIAADYELITRFLGKYKISTVYLPIVIVKMRWGGKSNNNIKNIIIKSKEDYKSIKKNEIGGIYTLFLKNFSKIKQFVK
ncbi:MAG: glycosyltransferase [Bacteroidales bacterium]|nr:glycosyltransferase [Bacteroidales bacterium]MBN2755930.1 glycosyltransferase [Bacteroidales bacterium]